MDAETKKYLGLGAGFVVVVVVFIVLRQRGAFAQQPVAASNSTMGQTTTPDMPPIPYTTFNVGPYNPGAGQMVIPGNANSQGCSRPCCGDGNSGVGSSISWYNANQSWLNDWTTQIQAVL